MGIVNLVNEGQRMRMSEQRVKKKARVKFNLFTQLEVEFLGVI